MRAIFVADHSTAVNKVAVDYKNNTDNDRRVKAMKTINQKFLAAALAVSGMVVSGCSITDVTSSTSGTLDTVTPDVTLNHFIDPRLASLQKEAAKGDGENLDALAELAGKDDKPAFSSWMHDNYDALFTDLERPNQLISRIQAKQGGLI